MGLACPSILFHPHHSALSPSLREHRKIKRAKKKTGQGSDGEDGDSEVRMGKF